MPKTEYAKDQLKRLQKTRYAAKYLKAALEEGDEPAFLLGLRNVVEAHGGISAVARESSIARQHLHRMLAEGGNPTLSRLIAVLNAVGITLDFEAKDVA